MHLIDIFFYIRNEKGTNPLPQIDKNSSLWSSSMNRAQTWAAESAFGLIISRSGNRAADAAAHAFSDMK